MIEKLGITPGKDGWDEEKCEMLELLLECRNALFHEDTLYKSCVVIWIQTLMVKASGLTWAEVKERIG